MMALIKGARRPQMPESRCGAIAAVSRAYREQDMTMTKIDCLIEVAKKLREARSLAERSSDRALLYFIDMALAHVCDSLDARSETKGAEDKHTSLVKAAA
jgi:hypothetical protein